MKLQLQMLIGFFVVIIIVIFAVFQNYNYIQTSQAQEQQQEIGERIEKKVELTSHKVESGKNLSKFIGQVHNTINKNVEYVTIIATFYDKDGKIIGSKSIYTKPNAIKPNMTAPFEMMLNNGTFSNITSYDVAITWRFPGESERYSNVYG